jgi:hypothetical protein
MHVLVTAASRHETTHEIADAIAADFARRASPRPAVFGRRRRERLVKESLGHLRRGSRAA